MIIVISVGLLIFEILCGPYIMVENAKFTDIRKLCSAKIWSLSGNMCLLLRKLASKRESFNHGDTAKGETVNLGRLWMHLKRMLPLG